MKNLLELIAEFRDWQKQWDNAVVTFPSDVEQFMQTLSQKYSVTKINAGLTFGQAIEAMKDGKKVCRQGWNGKGMFLYYVPANKYPASRNTLNTLDGLFEDNMVPYGAYIAMKTAQDNVIPWLASQTDILAEDWVLLD